MQYAKMNVQTDKTPTPRFDFLKWIIVCLLIAAGVYGNFYFAAQPGPIRIAGWIFLFLVAGFVALQTKKGVRLRSFARASRQEMRKVVWPNRQETVQTTMVVAVVVVITALLVWAIDSILFWAVRALTGQV